MRNPDLLASIQIGDGPAYLQNSVVGSCAHILRLKNLLQKVRFFLSETTELIEVPDRHLRIEEDRILPESFPLDLMDPFHIPTNHLRTFFLHLLFLKIPEMHRGCFHAQVHTIQQWTADPMKISSSSLQ